MNNLINNSKLSKFLNNFININNIKRKDVYNIEK
jgi:hypothetical protein